MNDEYLIKIDEPRIQETCDAYFKWKDLNIYVKSLVSRGINMPDEISEPMGCYCLNLLWNKSSGGDYQKAGKRPHFSIIQSIIEARKLEPTVIFNIRRGMIVEKR